MFYDYNLMNSSTLGVVWCYANRQKVVSDNVGIPKICSTIEKLVDHNGTRKNRLSLRSSTLLLNGTARLYKEELDKLYQDSFGINHVRVELCQECWQHFPVESLCRFSGQKMHQPSCVTSGDCIQLNSQMLYRRSRDASLADDNNTGSEEHSNNSNNRDESKSAKNHRFHSKNNSDNSDTTTKDSTDYESSAMTSFTSDQSQVSNRPFAIHKIDAEVQTNKSYIGNIKKREKCKRKQTLDVNLPMGVIMVYDEFNSPSKIICANINRNVKHL